MMKMALSPAAFGLLRALTARAEVPRERILLSSWRSVDWQSLTFVGERHHISLRISGPNSAAAVARLTDGLEDAEFDIPGQIVADVTVVGGPDSSSDGSTTLNIEALTIAE
jgi:hypothetical protein